MKFQPPWKPVTSTLHSLVQSVNNIAQIINTNNYPTTFLPLQQTKMLGNLFPTQTNTTTQIIENSQDSSFSAGDQNNTKNLKETNDRTPQ